MTSLRLKIQKSFQKLLRPSKRRMTEEDEVPEQTKQSRTFAAQPAGPGMPQPSSAIPIPSSCIFTPSPTFQTPSPSLASPSTFERMSNHPLYGGNGLPGTETNPIDLTESQDGAGPGPAYPAALAPWTGDHMPFSKHPWDPSAPPLFDSAIPDSTGQYTLDYADQIIGEHLLAQRLEEQSAQQEPSLEHGFFAKLDKVDRYEDLVAYGKRIKSARCAKCNTPVYLDGLTLVKNIVKSLKKGYLNPCIQCTKCRGWFCIGGDTYNKDHVPVLRHVASGKNLKVTWCCDEGRMLLIFYLLCGFEHTTFSTPTKTKTKFRSRSEPSLGAAKPGPASPSSSRQQGQSILSKGTGYGPAINTPPVKAAAPAGNDNMGDMEMYFQALSFVLPCMTKQTTTRFDCEPQQVVQAMVSRSPMLHHASELLRSATIEEIGARHGLITAVLDFVETITGHWNTARYVLRERVLFPRTEQLLVIVLGSSVKPNNPLRETAQSLYIIIQQLAIPCRRFIEASKRVENMETEDEQGSLAIMKRICTLADMMISSGARTEYWGLEHQTVPGSTGGSSTMNPEVSKELLATWHKANCVKDLPDKVILDNFVYAKDAAAAEKAKPAPGRMRKLLAQVASLSTALPDGIYVRHGESRPDLLKILITGPAGTPYENGLFEFDMFCGKNFPKSPPKMHFRTTGGGVINFNPNLYLNGKICLSLLGTWEGQPWEPERSTILQILVSIQSMILNDKPFFNEPGYETRADNGRAEGFNRNLEPMTVQHAMLYWLNDRLKNSHRQTAATKDEPAPPRLSPMPPAPWMHQGTLLATLTAPPSAPSAGLPAKPSAPPPAPYKPPSNMPPASWMQQSALNAASFAHPSAPPAGPSSGQPSALPPAPWMDLGPPPSALTSLPPTSWMEQSAPHPALASLPTLASLDPLAEANVTFPPPPPGHAPPINPYPGGQSLGEFSLSEEALDLYMLSEDIFPQQHVRRPPLSAKPKKVRDYDDPVWGEVIRKHFELKAGVIVETARAWEKKAVKLRTAQNMKWSADMIEKRLKEEGFLEGKGDGGGGGKA